jgi:hypothetical protein
MIKHQAVDSIRLNGALDSEPVGCPKNWETSPKTGQDNMNGHMVYRVVWYGINVLLLASILFVLYTTAWEYSTRRYLKGFSDAVVPALATPEQKILGILNWMSNGPARLDDTTSTPTENRDPTDTLNYKSLLKVCGSATNAFINLADSSGLSARRLLLLDSDGGARHVVAEVHLNGQWIVVDPSFRTILRDSRGGFLTSRNLADPQVFAMATRDIPDYDPSYTYMRTEHIRLKRMFLFGSLIRRTFDLLHPGWDESPALSLLLERTSFAGMITALLFLLFILLVRIFVRWIGEHRLGLSTPHFRHRIRRAGQAFLATTG